MDCDKKGKQFSYQMICLVWGPVSRRSSSLRIWVISYQSLEMHNRDLLLSGKGMKRGSTDLIQPSLHSAGIFSTDWSRLWIRPFFTYRVDVCLKRLRKRCELEPKYDTNNGFFGLLQGKKRASGKKSWSRQLANQRDCFTAVSWVNL